MRNHRKRYPLIWLLGCVVTIFFIPSLFSFGTHVCLRGPISLAMVGLTDPEVVWKTNGEFVAMQSRIVKREVEKRVRPKRIRVRLKKGEPLPFLEIIDRVAREHEISPALTAAVIRVESAFQPYARSVRGARGLMQLLPATARKVGVYGDIDDPEKNIRAGVRYLRMMLDRYGGDEKLALAAYNAGPAAVDRHQSIPPYRETREYVPLVLQYSEEYDKFFTDS